MIRLITTSLSVCIQMERFMTSLLLQDLIEQANDNHSEIENLISGLNKYNPTSRNKKKF